MRIEQCLSSYGYVYGEHYSDDDIAIVKYVAALISYRAAQLVAINTAVLINRLDEQNVTIAIDGSVYKLHPRLGGWLERLIAKRVTNGKQV